MPPFEQPKTLNERWVRQQAECETLLKETGIKGSIITVEDDTEGVNVNYSGIYLSLKEIPPLRVRSRVQAVFLHDQDTYELVRDTHTAGVPIFLKAGIGLLDAACVPANHPLERALNREGSPEDSIIITPETDYFRLKHEIQHHNDNKQHLKKQIFTEIEQAFPTSQIQETQRQHIIRFITEQRGHFQEALALSAKNAAGKTSAPEMRANHVVAIPFSGFYERRKSSIKDELLQYYGITLAAILDQQKTEDPQTYSAIKNIIKKYTLSNPNIPEFDLKQLLSDHFD